LGPGQLARNEEKLVAKLLQGETLPGFIETGPLKRGDEVVSKPNEFEV
jgi:hypothetical protein